MSYAPDAAADNRRLNSSVVSNVYTVQRQAGCTDNITVDPRLLEAARRHTLDVLNNRSLDGDIGSDGSTPQVRAINAGFRGRVAETVAINRALAINNLDVINQWYHRPDYLAIMQDCGFTRMGVWSENSLDRSVLVAVYGSPEV
ncbi:CAP domain-containing protein [Mycolicibacterium goodii]